MSFLTLDDFKDPGLLLEIDVNQDPNLQPPTDTSSADMNANSNDTAGDINDATADASDDQQTTADANNTDPNAMGDDTTDGGGDGQDGQSSPVDSIDNLNNGVDKPLDPNESSERLFYFDKFYELQMTFKTLNDFLQELILNYSDDDKLETILKRLVDNVDNQMFTLRDLLEDGILVSLPIVKIKELYKLYTDTISLIAKQFNLLMTKSNIKKLGAMRNKLNARLVSESSTTKQNNIDYKIYL